MRTFWRSAFFVTLGTLTWLLLAPADQLPRVGLWDKLSHALAFAALAMLIHAGWARAPKPALWATLLSYSLLMEVLQTLVPGRTFTMLDLLADAVGIAGYAVAARLLPGRLPLGGAA
jgi:VanZ family protein